jgi:prepilin-type N-terminal cleavage/methylation domain-containing protein
LRRSTPAGLTLIEVVAAIAILGSILVGIMLATSRHSRQLALAERKKEAVRAADKLITRWRTQQDGVPINQEGRVKFNDSLRWRTRRVNNETIEKLSGRVVRLSLHMANPQETALDPKDYKLMTVDLVLPAKKKGESKGATSGWGSSDRGGRS